MATKLKSLFREPRSALALRTLFFVLLFLAARAADFSFLPTMLFLGGAAALFFMVPAAGRGYGRSFTVFLVFAFVAIHFLAGRLPAFFIITFLGILFGILLAMRMLIFTRRTAHAIFTLVASYAALFTYAILEPSLHGVVKSFLLWLGLFFIFSEFFTAQEDAQFVRISQSATRAGIVALIAVESAWASSFLPLTVLAASTLSFAATVGAWEVLEWSRREKLSKSHIFWIAAILYLTVAALISTSGMRR